MKNRLLSYCEDYARAPAMYDIESEQYLVRRYQDLQLRSTSELRLSRLCTQPGSGDQAIITLSSQP